MKLKLIYTLLFALVAVNLSAQRPDTPNTDKVSGKRQFQIIVTNAKDSTIVKSNRGLRAAKERSIVQSRGFVSDLAKAYSNVGVTRTVGASSALLDLGINTLATALKSDRDKWYQAAKSLCVFRRNLRSGSEITDFYAACSEKGALDPENMRFEGFGCYNYIEQEDVSGCGNDAFYIFCSLRRDSVGLNHITNHSKFLVEVDTLMFAPKYCNLPNDTTGRLDARFDFNGRKNLTFNIKVRIYSSWINEAILLTQNQLLGEFNISAEIRPEALVDGRFVYSKHNADNAHLVHLSGDSFIVPRSFTGTADANTYRPMWGTGQYTIEMEVAECCEVDDEYYKKDDGSGKWDKKKWKPEWEYMKASQKKSPNLARQAIQKINVDYKDNGWVCVITEPLKTTLIKSETVELKKLLK